MSSITFCGFRTDSIAEWQDAILTGTVDPEKHKNALSDDLLVEINGEFYAAPAKSRGLGNPSEWVGMLNALKSRARLIRVDVPTIMREFGNGPIAEAISTPRESSDKEEHTSPLIAETASTTEIAPEVPEESVVEESSSPASGVESETPAPEQPTEPPVEEPVEPKLDDNLRAKVSALPTYYAPLKEPLMKLIDLGADLLVIDTALELAGKPRNLGQIADYARHISVGAQDNRDLITLVQSAHRAACKVENASDAVAAILVKVMSYVPDNRKTVFKGRLEEQIEKGLSKYWAEAWAQTEAALEAGRTTTPVNLFINIVKDMDRNAGLAEQRGTARINNFSECRWIMEYLPKSEVDYSVTSLNRGGRKFYLPKMKDAIERQGHIPLTWVMSLVVDNDYPTRVLAPLAEKMIEKYPALARIVTREQFEYAMTLVAKVFLERANRVRESWDGRENLAASLTHHACYAGHQYVETLKEHSDYKARFMDPLKDLLKSVLENQDARMIMSVWYLHPNPWRHGKTPEAAHDHLKEEIAYNERAAIRAAEAAQSGGCAEAGTD